MINFKTLEPNDIEVRVQQVTEKGCSLLLYKDARCDMRMLDEAVGNENWDCSYERIGDGLFCTVGIRCVLEGGEVTWVYKQDVGVESNMEPTKGEASDAFKRACFKWGIGRELYTAPFVWVEAGLLNKHYNDKGRWKCGDRFRVNHIEVKNGRITDLVIENAQGLTVYQMGRKVSAEKKRNRYTSEAKTAPQNALQSLYERIRQLKAEAVGLGVKEQGIEDWIAANFDKPKKELGEAELARIEGYLKGIIADMKKVRNG